MGLNMFGFKTRNSPFTKKDIKNHGEVFKKLFNDILEFKSSNILDNLGEIEITVCTVPDIKKENKYDKFVFYIPYEGLRNGHFLMDIGYEMGLKVKEKVATFCIFVALKFNEKYHIYGSSINDCHKNILSLDIKYKDNIYIVENPKFSNRKEVNDLNVKFGDMFWVGFRQGIYDSHNNNVRLPLSEHLELQHEVK